MRVLTIFIQIIMFPITIFFISTFINRWVSKKNTLVSKICYATNFTTIAYVIGGGILFPLYMAFKPIKINGITYLTGNNLWIYWMLSYIIVTPAVYIVVAYFQYFKKTSIKNYYKEASFLGIYSLLLSLIMEIIIYVYWRKTIPSVYDYFFGKNFPWIDINWIVGLICVFIAAIIAKARKNNSKNI